MSQFINLSMNYSNNENNILKLKHICFQIKIVKLKITIKQ